PHLARAPEPLPPHPRPPRGLRRVARPAATDRAPRRHRARPPAATPPLRAALRPAPVGRILPTRLPPSAGAGEAAALRGRDGRGAGREIDAEAPPAARASAGPAGRAPG